MAGTVLLTLGRLPKGLDIARSFDALGWRVIVAEPFDWNLCALSKSVSKSYAVPAPNTDIDGYYDAMRDIVRREHIDLIVPISEETLHVSALKGQLPDKPKIFCGNHDALLKLHDKLAFATSLQDTGLRAPLTATLTSPEALAIAEAGGYIVKDRFGASGSRIQFLKQGDALPKDRPNAIVQERLLGREISTFSIVHAGKVSQTVVYEPVIRDGTVATVFQRIVDTDPDARGACELAASVAATSGHTGFLSFDLMATGPGEVVAFECNPRANSGIHFIETAAIAPAIKSAGEPVPLRKSTRLQQAYPTLTLLWGSLGRWSRYRQVGKALLTTRDVSWGWRDPLPFILMTPATWPLIKQSIFQGRSLGEAAIADIGWFGEPSNPVKATV
ncbi:MAG: ATP-grasp domain-containing protein [Pseudomonadota bacterium]